MNKLIHLVFIVFTLSILKAQQPPPPVLYPNESYTKLYSVSYDFQSNGSVRYIAEDPIHPENKCAIIMAQLDTIPGARKTVYYSYLDDDIWYPDIISLNWDWEFPDLSLSNGIPIVSLSKESASTAVTKDLYFGAYGFNWVGTFPVGILWPHLAGIENGNVVVAGNDSLNLMGKYSTYNYNSSTWLSLTSLPLISGTSGSICVATGVNGNVGIFGIDNINTHYIYWYKSNDYGITFDTGTVVFKFLVDGSDTLRANSVGGFQALYLNNEPQLVFTVYKVSPENFPNPHTKKYIKPMILHWSPTTGIRTIADRFKINNLSDTITSSNIAPLGQPSIGIWKDYVLFCSFTAFLKGNTQIVDDGTVVNAGEIFVARSFNASRWNTPVNITGTPYIEEKNSSLPVKSNQLQSPSIFYLRDMKAGNWVDVPSWGKAPVYGIFKNNLNSTVGINQINTHTNQYDLFQNYPNPFNASTVIKFSIPEVAFTSLLIYDIRGIEVALLVKQKLNPGSYEYDFNGDDYALPSGIYFYKLTSGDYTNVKKMTLLK